ncbi:Hint domain-containing protein [Frigidibacter sp. ROC022]|uniref:Hint domain-containing protein n=1 Tax=Frigidibacter sp. ROC022 TaxID=2971796 RepID=UPI003083DB26
MPAQSLPVYRSADFTVINGANLGDGLAHAAELMLDDIYALRPHARRHRLALSGGNGATLFQLTEGSEIGTPGQDVHLDCALTFMCPDGATVEALVFVEVTPDSTIAACYLLPLAPLEPRRDYALVAIDRTSARAKLAEIACVSFALGTHITMANGLQKRIETLSVGDRVLTRDNGPRAIRWIGRQTVRATGTFAPILIAKGALNNSGDLMLSPNHRLFIYQRRDRIRAGRPEVLVRAGHLVNGDTVVQSDGGFVDYFQLLFDQHEIIYAEGIAAESLLIDPRTQPVIPAEVRARLAEGSRAGRDDRAAFEIGEGLLDASVAADLLRRASAC